MKIVCVTDQLDGADHSSIEGIFGRHLRELCDVTLVFFSRERGETVREGNRIIVPYAWKRRSLCAELDRFISLGDVDVMIVRNYFPVLGSVLAARSRYGFRVGFWHSFPHSFRRLFEARQERRAVMRKSIEYFVRSRMERRLVDRCDFLISMSDEFRDTFYPSLTIPFLPLPMGVSLDGFPAYCPEGGETRRFIYTGAVDHLRRTDFIAEALSELKDDFILDIYTRSDNATTARIAALNDRRIRLCAPMPRSELLQKMSGYDAGIGLIPENDLYKVSSPTKTLEYYGVGMPAIVNYLPEYVALFDDDSAFFCPFTQEGIRDAARQVIRTPRECLASMGERGRNVVSRKRNYAVLGHAVYEFLKPFAESRRGETNA